MKPSHPLLQLPAETTARVLIRLALDEATAAAEQLDLGDDPDAASRLGAALLQIRDHLRLFRPSLGEVVGTKERRRLVALVKAAGRVGELRAAVRWLRSGAGSGGDSQRAAREWMVHLMEPELAGAMATLRRTLRRHLLPLRKRLQRLTASYVVVVDPAHLQPTAQVRDCGAGLVERGAARLALQLQQVRTAEDLGALRRARSGAESLHGLLGGFSGAGPAIAALAGSVRMLRKVLEEMRENQVLVQRVGAAGAALPPDAAHVREDLARLLLRLRSHRQLLFRELRTAWLADNSATVPSQAREVARALRGEPATDVEIERKFLLRAMPDLPASAESVRIEQGWIPGERLLERVRCVSSADGQRWYRTVKLGRGVQRMEIEEETSREIFDALWPLTHGRRIRKQRFRVPGESGVWEIDHFAERNLVLAEIELQSPEAPVAFPDWLVPVVEREVTDDSAYVNANLAC